MINIGRVANSRMFTQSLTLRRYTGGEFKIGGFEDPTAVESTITGIAYPSSEKEIMQVPEGDRIRGMHTFISTTELKVSSGTNSANADRIKWKGEWYKLVSLLDFGDYGAYIAVGVRMEGD